MNHSLEPRWQPISSLSGTVPEHLHTWLTAEVSLTKRLQQLGTFTVELTGEEWGKSLPSESQLLTLTQDEPVWQRRVVLRVNDCPKVVAHTVIPSAALDNIPGLKELGQHSLGDLIFGELHGVRSQLEFARLTSMHDLFILSMPMTDATELWARRSLLVVKQWQVLVNEVFLLK